MGDLLFIDVAKRERDLTVQEAWDAYVAADAKAKASLRLEDGIAAGKAYARFLDLYASRRA